MLDVEHKRKKYFKMYEFKADRNHGRNGFTFAGRIYQFLVSTYSKYIL